MLTRPLRGLVTGVCGRVFPLVAFGIGWAATQTRCVL